MAARGIRLAAVAGGRIPTARSPCGVAHKYGPAVAFLSVGAAEVLIDLRTDYPFNKPVWVVRGRSGRLGQFCIYRAIDVLVRDESDGHLRVSTGASCAASRESSLLVAIIVLIGAGMFGKLAPVELVLTMGLAGGGYLMGSLLFWRGLHIGPIRILTALRTRA